MQPIPGNNMKIFHLSLNYSDSQVAGLSPTWVPLRSGLRQAT